VPSATVSSASMSATRDTPQFPLSLPNFLCPHSPAVLCAVAVVRHRRLGLPPRLRRNRGVPGVRLEVRNLPRPLPSFLLPPPPPLHLIPRRSPLAPPPSRFAVGRPPPVPLSRPSPHRKVPRALPNLPGHPGRPKDPQSPRAPHLRRVLRRGNRRCHLC
jgi:hypothetical protein